MVVKLERIAMTVAEYLALEEERQEKYEYADGYACSMAGMTIAEGAIANTVRGAIHMHLQGGQCNVHGSALRVRAGTSVYYYPDAFVIRDETISGDATEVTTPCLIVEVLSDSTEANDRGAKFAHYQTLATVEEYLLVDSRQRSVERFRRTTPNLWTYQRYGADDDVTLETIGLTCPVTRFYDRTQL